MIDTSPRLALPLLAAGQAQKEVVHNEALAILDALVQSVVMTAGDDTPPLTPPEGQSWIVGAAPTGAWAGQAGRLATWTGGGWRFVMPFEGLSAWNMADGLVARWSGGAWTTGICTVASVVIGGQQVVGARQATVSDPVGGAVIDLEARAAISGILAAVRNHGLIAL